MQVPTDVAEAAYQEAAHAAVRAMLGKTWPSDRKLRKKLAQHPTTQKDEWSVAQSLAPVQARVRQAVRSTRRGAHVDIASSRNDDVDLFSELAPAFARRFAEGYPEALIDPDRLVALTLLAGHDALIRHTEQHMQRLADRLERAENGDITESTLTVVETTLRRMAAIEAHVAVAVAVLGQDDERVQRAVATNGRVSDAIAAAVEALRPHLVDAGIRHEHIIG